MVEIEVFRYDVKIDLGSYYKPYCYENFNFKNLNELFIDIEKNDPYFKFGNVKFVYVNDFLVSAEDDFSKILEKTGKHFIISPIIEKRVIKDFIINNDDFIKAFGKFQNFKDEKEYYLTLEPLFYANRVLEYKKEFIGNSAFVFAYHMIEKFPEKTDEILSIIKDELKYYIKPRFLLDDPFKTDEKVSFLKEKLGIKTKSKEKFKYFTELLSKFDKNEYPANFSKFNIAVYDDQEVENFVKNIGARLINFRLKNNYHGGKFYNFDKDCAIALASEILFDAFDSGSDFLVVNDKDAFMIFDTHYKEIENYTNRSLHNYYVLSADEFVSITKGKTVESLKKHSLKVHLVD
ncbi:hypothetical protein CBLAS_1086 [Campylobacter blaseri]|uniref:DUF5644 domain-containing protein n=1 Tax=Campylobacter blaseri TaxID=2042961 RepID=A0A2P8QZJ4_9BACT|nr:hypothetical protein [Campylobacter blaseri]PSM51665.1 hypothetical protein CQ405_05910 [Campylobacter blaseri]PSM53455.1 hypothetical protein CRN67_05910 [Campylobacter blaseri]QKF86260.1 hypothetical protein CBLAS_1086 [Campylobacter blaseri]